MNETVCERIDRLIKERTLSRRRLALQAGISPSSFQSAMQRNNGLSLDMLIPISQALNVDPVWLRTGTEKHAIYEYNKIEYETQKYLESVPNHPQKSPEQIEREKQQEERTKEVMSLLVVFNRLNPIGRREALKRINDLTFNPAYLESDKDAE